MTEEHLARADGRSSLSKWLICWTWNAEERLAIRPWQRTLKLTDNAMRLMEKDVELFWGYLYPLFETLLRLISSKRPIDNAKRENMKTILSRPIEIRRRTFINDVNKPPRPLRPWQRTVFVKFKFLNWNTNKDKLLDPALVYDMNHINDISDINDGRKTSFDKPGGGGAP